MNDPAYWSGKMTPELTVTARVQILCFALNSVTSAWGFPLIAKEFEKEWELQNRLFTLMVYGLLDAVREYRSRINGIRIEAKKINSLSCLFYLDVFSKHISNLAHFLEMFSVDEALLISELRNQRCHGRWTEMMSEKRTTLYVENGELRKLILKAATYNERFVKILKSNPDDALSPLRKRFIHRRTYFWVYDRIFNLPEFREQFTKDLMQHSSFKAPTAIFMDRKLPGPSDKGVIGGQPYLSLFELAPKDTAPRN